MPSPKPQKIDLNKDYPCPCGRKGRLVPIALTEAFGCNRCQQIFVLEQNEQAIELLSSTYPSKKAWLWTGSRWYRTHTGLKENNWRLVLLICFVLSVVWVVWFFNFYTGNHKLFWAMVPVILIPLLALIWWLAYRH